MGSLRHFASWHVVPGQPRSRLLVTCAAAKELKPLRKSLERKQKEILDVTAALQSSKSLDSPLALHSLVLHLQRLGCEAEALVCQAEEALLLEETPIAEEAVLQPPSAATAAPLHPNASIPADPLAMHSEGAGIPAEAMAEELADVREPALEAMPTPHLADPFGEAETASIGSSPLPVASLLPQTSRMWEEARTALGDASEASISVCQGKACSKAGSAVVLQELMGIAEANAGLEVATTKCLDRCKQGPCLEVSNPVAGAQVCVSKEKPPKKQKMLRKLMAF